MNDEQRGGDGGEAVDPVSPPTEEFAGAEWLLAQLGEPVPPTAPVPRQDAAEARPPESPAAPAAPVPAPGVPAPWAAPSDPARPESPFEPPSPRAPRDAPEPWWQARADEELPVRAASVPPTHPTPAITPSEPVSAPSTPDDVDDSDDEEQSIWAPRSAVKPEQQVFPAEPGPEASSNRFESTHAGPIPIVGRPVPPVVPPASAEPPSPAFNPPVAPLASSDALARPIPPVPTPASVPPLAPPAAAEPAVAALGDFVWNLEPNDEPDPVVVSGATDVTWPPVAPSPPPTPPIEAVAAPVLPIPAFVAPITAPVVRAPIAVPPDIGPGEPEAPIGPTVLDEVAEPADPALAERDLGHVEDPATTPSALRLLGIDVSSDTDGHADEPYLPTNPTAVVPLAESGAEPPTISLEQSQYLDTVAASPVVSGFETPPLIVAAESGATESGATESGAAGSLPAQGPGRAATQPPPGRRAQRDAARPPAGSGGSGSGRGTGSGAGAGGRPPREPWPTNTRVLVGIAIALVAILVLVALYLLGRSIAATSVASATSTPTPTVSETPTPTPVVEATGSQPPGAHEWETLRGGECLDPYGSPWDETFTVVDCAPPHPAQMVFTGVFNTDPAAAFPGEDPLAGQINLLCSAPGVIDLEVAGQFADVQLQGSYPVTAEQWDAGQRSYFCFASRSSGEPLSGTLVPPAG